ncbi:L-aspartate oxidase [Sporomusa acidovorans]|uniref:L-aspartate oxidase n=1 Tax=Sporomusa acidovorans (strain ATCC 49682 / DSM 3132 / Mol) TaxID=1123286 RepID=A0ABZ3J738_SPOA4|nr:FAD-dependent oxidoreductase [Sporomusa acidovorans]OZC19686.1 L-aspartate oxidase [Sporomusa acidovorans DSM 3132]SDF72384.1 L-aspartate oxidase [Sporomusa acidovorans]
MEIVKSDVLIIGGGLAGMMAALAARSCGKAVTIVSKRPIGKAGNTLVSGGGISSATGEEQNNAENFLQDIMRSGKGLNNGTLAHKLAAESPSILRQLEEYGVKLVRKDGSYKKRRPPGHSVPRNIPTDWTGLAYQNRGLSFMLPLLDRIREQNIATISGVRIFQLIKSDSRVVGAIGVDKENNAYQFLADGVVLATGGEGYLFAKTNNTSDITGDGLALALAAGCRLQDMEQVQFYPTMMFDPVKVPISNPLFGAGAVLRNAAGERFMKRYDSAGDMATRDNMARAIFMEIQAGRGIDNCIYVDCTGIPSAQLKEQYKDFYQFLLAAKIDPTKDFIKVSPCVHYSLGGVVIDEFAATGVPGLYAAGEICGGIHGANRLSGAALMEACVFGRQAGISAASQPAQQKSERTFESKYSPNFTIGDCSATFNTVRRKMWEDVSLIRSEQSLQRMNDYIDRMAQETASGSLQSVYLRDLLRVAKTIVQSALVRKESRGAHFRRDYPQINPAFAGNVQCWLEEDELLFKFMPINTMSS